MASSLAVDPYKPRMVETMNRDQGREKQENGSPSQGKTLDQDMAAFRECVQSIGTQFDSGENRREMRRLRSIIKQRIADSEKKLKKNHGRSSGAERLQLEQQSKQLDSQLRNFQYLLQEEVRATKQHPNAPVTATPPSLTAGVDSTDYGGDYFGHTQQIQQVSQIDQREMEAQELVELERDVNDLHMIQQDMAEIVGDQGEAMGRIDQQVSRIQIRVEHAQKQVKKAKELKKRRCGLCWYLLCCCCC